MVVGNGMLGKSFVKYDSHDSVIIFASGVSNSQNTDIEEFRREKELLLHIIRDYKTKALVYFSSCHIDEYISIPYYQHKSEMEKIIQKEMKHYWIFRLPQVVGYSGNNATLINYFIFNILNNNELTLWNNTKRNIIDVEDVFKISEYFIDNYIYVNKIVNIASPYNYSILDIVKKIETFLNKEAVFKVINKGNSLEINIDDLNIYKNELNVNFNESYLENVLNKYYKDFKGKK